MNIVVPMAGRGSRVALRDRHTPKPLIEVAGRPMIAWALESLGPLLDGARVVFVILEAHEHQRELSRVLRGLAGADAEIVALEEVTEGQLCTVLAATSALDRDADLLIASCDTYVLSDLSTAIRNRPAECRGIISVADVPGDRWSFARTDETGRVVEVAEKQRISNHASTGLYYFSSTPEFLDEANSLIRAGEKTRGEYYVMPVYQRYIAAGKRIDISTAAEMWDMGTVEGLEAFGSSRTGSADTAARIDPTTVAPNVS